MKKYLMTGMAAIAFCAVFTSCSKTENLYDPTAADEMEKAQIVANYNKAFIATFGQPAANQDWGFGSSAMTRAANVEGNLWHDPNYYNLKNDPPVTVAEKRLVFNYVNNPTQVQTVNQISFTDYWVSQIWDGDADKNAEGVMAPITHSYPNQNGNITDIVGGAQMDKLEIEEAEGQWIHCNNFNGGTNNDWKEDGEGGRTLMQNSGTLSFRYTNSQSSYLSEKYIIVPGANIDASLAGFYYVCFDFERGYTANESESEKTMGTYEAWNGNNYQGGWNFTLDGRLNEDQVKAAIGQVGGKDIQNIVIKGYLYGDKHCDGDDNYTDWIVRISPAEVISSDWDIRIMAEDLNAEAITAAAAEDGLTDSDWDFNDVVFDVKFTSQTTANVKIVCAGGVLPLYVAGHEVHKALGQSQPGEDGLYRIIGMSNAATPFEVTGINKDNNGKDIEVTVERKLNSGAVAIFTLEAQQGVPAAKIGVEPGFTPCSERQDIRTRYPLFSRWVTEGPNFSWYTVQ